MEAQRDRTTSRDGRLPAETPDRWPRRTPFLRSFGPEKHHGDRSMGSPMHPVIATQDLPGDRVRVWAFLARPAFGPPRGIVGPTKDRKGHAQALGSTVYGGRVPAMTDPNRYLKVDLSREEYDSLPVCSWKLRNEDVTDVQRVDLGNQAGGTDDS